jgi:hypothetical protein
MVEAFLRRAEACGRGALVNEIGRTLSAITAETCGASSSIAATMRHSNRCQRCCGVATWVRAPVLRGQARVAAPEQHKEAGPARDPPPMCCWLCSLG